jgi:hypothetical protein
MCGSAYLARERVAVRDLVRLAVERPAALPRVPVRDVARFAVERPAALRRVPVRDVARLAVERPAALRRVPVRDDAFAGEERARRFWTRSMSRSMALLSLPLSRRASLMNF